MTVPAHQRAAVRAQVERWVSISEASWLDSCREEAAEVAAEIGAGVYATAEAILAGRARAAASPAYRMAWHFAGEAALAVADATNWALDGRQQFSAASHVLRAGWRRGMPIVFDETAALRGEIDDEALS